MDRECNKCVYHTSGSCSAWECKGTVTVEDVRADAINERASLLAFICRKYGIPLMDMNCTVDEWEQLYRSDGE